MSMTEIMWYNWSTRHTRITRSTYSSLDKEETKTLHIKIGI